ncbi:MAG TPA: heme ABC transporter ATP-binding protein [Chthoniobacterales bacterium]
MLTGTQLTVVRQHRRLVSEVDFTARSGEVTAILGRNGAGKSTLLRCLSGELKPAAGTVAYFDRALPDWKPLELARIRAVVAQSSSLSFPFRLREVVELGRSPHSTQSDGPVQWALAQLDLLSLADRDYPTLSGGERQRTHFARALAQIYEAAETGRGFLLLDEPTSSLDLAHQHQALRCAKALTGRGLGVVAVLHDLNLCARYADTVYLLDEGIRLACGPAAEVLDPPLLSRAYRIPIRKAGGAEMFDVEN